MENKKEIEINLFTIKQLESASILLDLINEGLLKKEKYHSIAVFTEKGFDVFICGRKVDKDKLELQFNILDFEGNIPNGFSANWRNYEHIKKDLDL